MGIIFNRGNKCRHYSKCKREGVMCYNTHGTFRLCHDHIAEWNNNKYIERPECCKLYFLTDKLIIIG